MESRGTGNGSEAAVFNVSFHASDVQVIQHDYGAFSRVFLRAFTRSLPKGSRCLPDGRRNCSRSLRP